MTLHNKILEKVYMLKQAKDGVIDDPDAPGEDLPNTLTELGKAGITPGGATPTAPKADPKAYKGNPYESLKDLYGRYTNPWHSDTGQWKGLKDDVDSRISKTVGGVFGAEPPKPPAAPPKPTNKQRYMERRQNRRKQELLDKYFNEANEMGARDPRYFDYYMPAAREAVKNVSRLSRAPFRHFKHQMPGTQLPEGGDEGLINETMQGKVNLLQKLRERLGTIPEGQRNMEMRDAYSQLMEMENSMRSKFKGRTEENEVDKKKPLQTMTEMPESIKGLLGSLAGRGSRDIDTGVPGFTVTQAKGDAKPNLPFGVQKEDVLDMADHLRENYSVPISREGAKGVLEGVAGPVQRGSEEALKRYEHFQKLLGGEAQMPTRSWNMMGKDIRMDPNVLRDYLNKKLSRSGNMDRLMEMLGI